MPSARKPKKLKKSNIPKESPIKMESIGIVDDWHSKNPARTKKSVGKGLFHDRNVEACPRFLGSSAENVTSNGNAWIILGGADRPAAFESGYGAKGHHNANKIDIVVGRASSSDLGPSSDTSVHPNFFSDAARLYISQKTDIDTNFAIDHDPELSAFEGNVARSGIGLKADAVRIVGRESIKIVTGKGKNIESNGLRGELNSHGGEIDHIGKIDLIAGNNIEGGKLQPMILGRNMKMAIQELTDIVEDLQASLHNFAKYQNRINRALTTHTHIASAPGVPVSPSPDLGPVTNANTMRIMSSVMIPNIATKYNLMFYRLSYLKKFSKKWICSRNCRLT